jgi:RNA polymerase sigma-70 factor (ECF subfamily)
MSSPDGDLHSTQLQVWLRRMRQGDAGARDELLRSACGRLERIARGMLRHFPDVGRWEQTGDVLHNALLRLLRALESVEVQSVRAFFGLAAEQMRRELLDLARHYCGPHGWGANHESAVGSALDPPAPAEDSGELERWCAFHDEVERLPAEEREVVGLIFYHGWTQDEVAELFEVNVRTVQRWWQSARLALHRRVSALSGAG